MLTQLTADDIVSQPEKIKNRIKDFLLRFVNRDRASKNTFDFKNLFSEYSQEAPDEAKILKDAFYKAFLLEDTQDNFVGTTNENSFLFWSKFLLFKLNHQPDKSVLKRFSPFTGSNVAAITFDRSLEVFLFYMIEGKNRFDYRSFLSHDRDGERVNSFLRDNLVDCRENETLFSLLNGTLFDNKKDQEYNNMALIDFLLDVIKLCKSKNVRLRMPEFNHTFDVPPKERALISIYDPKADIVRRMYTEVVIRKAPLKAVIDSLTKLNAGYAFLFRKEDCKNCMWLSKRFADFFAGHGLFVLVAKENFDDVTMEYTQRYLEACFLHAVWMEMINY